MQFRTDKDLQSFQCLQITLAYGPVGGLPYKGGQGSLAGVLGFRNKCFVSLRVNNDENFHQLSFVVPFRVSAGPKQAI